MIHLQAADRQSPRDAFGTDTQASRTDVDTRVTSIIFESVIGSLRCELEPGDLMGSKGGSGSEEYALEEGTGSSTEEEESPRSPGDMKAFA